MGFFDYFLSFYMSFLYVPSFIMSHLFCKYLISCFSYLFRLSPKEVFCLILLFRHHSVNLFSFVLIVYSLPVSFILVFTISGNFLDLPLTLIKVLSLKLLNPFYIKILHIKKLDFVLQSSCFGQIFLLGKGT